jgi:hypothetical protein
MSFLDQSPSTLILFRHRATSTKHFHEIQHESNQLQTESNGFAGSRGGCGCGESMARGFGRDFVQGKIQFQHVDPRLAQKSKLPGLSVLANGLANRISG